MKKAKSLKTYGRTASRMRESTASSCFDQIMKRENSERSPFGTSDSSTGSCKDLEKKMTCKARQRHTKGKRVIMPIETNNSHDGHSHSPKAEKDSLSALGNSASFLGLSSCERPPRTTVLRSQTGNVKPKRKTVKKPCSRKSNEYTAAGKENSSLDKALDLSDIAQDSFVIEPEHVADTVPQSSTPTYFQMSKPVSRFNAHDVDISKIESDCESDPSYIIHESFLGSESHSSVHSNITLRRSARVVKQKNRNIWDQLMKNKFSQNVQSFDDDVIVKSLIEEQRRNSTSVGELEELRMWKKHSTPGKFQNSNGEALKVSDAEESLESSESNQSESLFESSDSEGEGEDLKSVDTDNIISRSSLERLRATLDEILEEDEDCIAEISEDCGQEYEHSFYEETNPSLKSQEESFYEKLSCNSFHQGVEVSAVEKVLSLCDQTDIIKFSACIPQRMMSECVKIGEGVYGEVFRSTSWDHNVAIKIVPIEGNFEVNDCPQKKFEEILPEVVIAKISCVQDSFPARLLDQWDEYAKRKPSENDRPDMFPDDQVFMVFEFADGGSALENFKFSSHTQAFSALRQVVYALAVAESALEFEHRDLHIGNILVKPCKEDIVSFVINMEELAFPSEGVSVTIIDFTISRLKKDGCAVFCDVSTDDGLFEGTGDIQFDVYRNMKEENQNDWSKFCPYTNILWVLYVCEKLNTVIKYKGCGRGHRDAQRKLRSLSSIIRNFKSCQDLARDLSLWVL